MEDLRFCNEFMSKQQHSQTPQKLDDSMQDDDFCLKYSGDEGIFKTAFYFIFLFFFWFHSIGFIIWFFSFFLLFVQIYTDIIADDLPLVDVCRRLSAENRNRNLNSKNQPADPPE
jgi:hypothetical protein